MYKNFEGDYEVCSCNQTTLKEIVEAITNKGADNLEAIGDLTDAGTVCECCMSADNDYSGNKKVYLDELLAHFKK